SFGQRLQEVGTEKTKFDAEQRVNQADSRERKGRRIAKQKHDHERRKHDRRDIMDKEGGHDLPPVSCVDCSIALMTSCASASAACWRPACGSGIFPIMTAARLMISEIA